MFQEENKIHRYLAQTFVQNMLVQRTRPKTINRL
jgi:hypothetical protein